jgi:hypothetical protein
VLTIGTVKLSSKGAVTLAIGTRNADLSPTLGHIARVARELVHASLRVLLPSCLTETDQVLDAA